MRFFPDGKVLKLFLGLVVLLATTALPTIALGAQGGLTPAGVSTDPGEPATAATPTPGSTECVTGLEGLRTCPPVTPAALVEGVAVPPENAPAAVKAAIAAANQIHTLPYIWGGGHAKWLSPGYDCSGAVSFALHGAGLISTPMDSGEMMNWGAPGKGRWITIYANAGHAWAVIDGVRWDTAGDESGTGPRWHPESTSTTGYVVRHPAGY